MLQSKETHEIERILYQLSSEVSEASESLRLNYLNLTELAFYFACAELSSRMHACEAAITEDRSIALRRARHPLIDAQKVVPIDVELGGT